MSLGAVQLCGWHQLQARRTDISRGIAKIDRDLVCRVSCNARRGHLRDRRLLITAQWESIHVARAAREVHTVNTHACEMHTPSDPSAPQPAGPAPPQTPPSKAYAASSALLCLRTLGHKRSVRGAGCGARARETVGGRERARCVATPLRRPGIEGRLLPAYRPPSSSWLDRASPWQYHSYSRVFE